MLIYVILLICVIISFYYTYTKILYIKQYENFSNFIFSNIENKNKEDNDYSDILIKYSSLNKSINNFQDIYDLQEMIIKISKYFYVNVLDIYTNNNNEIIDNINNNITLFMYKLGKDKLNGPVFVIIYKNYDLKEKEDCITIGKSMTYVKLIIIYTKYIEYDNNIIEKNNTPIFYNFFKKNYDKNNKATIYEINKYSKLFKNKFT